MTLVVELANKAASSWTDITDQVRVYDGMRVGGNAHLGEIGTGSGFDLDDDAGSLTLPVKRVLRVRDTDTSPDTVLVRGRIAGKGVARGDMPLGDARAFDVEIDDQNADLRGIPIKAWSRPEETDYQRVIALWKKFLKGNRRASTRLRIDYVRNANRRTLPKQTYRNTDPAGILTDIAEAAGKEFFVTVDGELFYDLPVSTKYAASLSITDDDPNMTDEFPPVFGASGDYDGSEFLSGATVEYGNKKRVSAVRSPVEDAHDYWRAIITEDATGQNDAKRRLKALLSSQAREDATYTVDLDLTADQVGLVKYGQTVSFRSAATGVTTPVVLRVGRLLWEPSAPGHYIAHLELGFPKKLAPRIKRGGSGGSAGGSGSNPGVYTAPQGPIVSPPSATTTAYLDHFDRDEAGPPSEAAHQVSVSPSAQTSHTVTLPDGVDEAGPRLVLFGINTGMTTTVEFVNGLAALGFQTFDVGNEIPRMWVASKVIEGDEDDGSPWAATGATIEVTTGASADFSVYAVLLDRGEAIEGTSWTAGGDPAELTPTWDSSYPAKFYTFVVSDDTISGDPTGFSSNAAGVIDAYYWRLSDKDVASTSAQDPDAYTTSGTAQVITIAVGVADSGDGLGSLPLREEVGGWWPGGNAYVTYFPLYVGDHGLDSGSFFAESIADPADYFVPNVPSGNNWIIALLGRDHPDGPFPVLPMEVDGWEMEARYRLLGASGSLTDPGLRYVYLDWFFSGAVRLNFGDATNAEGIQVIGETTETVTKSLAGVGNWGRIKWRWQGGRVYVKEWAESTSEPAWDTSAEVYSGLDPSDVEFDIAGRLGNATNPVMRFELDWLRMLVPDSSRTGYAGEVYGLTQTVAVT